MIYQGDSPNRPSMLLQQGMEANDYTVYIWVKASVFYGSYVQTMVQTQVSAEWVSFFLHKYCKIFN